MGRRKISVKKIDNLHARQICFSKRRKGLFSKANELCNQGGGEVAVLIFSSAGNLYCYGCPSVDAVVQRYFKHRFASAAAAATGEDNRGNLLAKGSQRQQHVEEGGRGWWWDVPVEGLELYELEMLHAMMGELKEKVAKRVGWLLGGTTVDGEASPHLQPSCVRQQQRKHYYSDSNGGEGGDAPSSN